jgi:hypothetical protein
MVAFVCLICTFAPLNCYQLIFNRRDYSNLHSYFRFNPTGRIISFKISQ